MSLHPSFTGEQCTPGLGSYSVCAVVVTYNPDPDLAASLNLLNSQVGQIVIVDNGSLAAARSLLLDLQKHLHCRVIQNESNLGIASALNQGCRFAVENGFGWIATFDQDSIVTNNFVQMLLVDAAGVKDLGMISPRYIDRYSMKAMPLPKTSSGSLIVTWTSGSMLRSDTYLKAGPFNEQLFIDSVDTEYCLRLRSMGLYIVESQNAVLVHSLGRITYHRILGKNLGTTNHSPSRRYYMMRNGLYVLSKYPNEVSWMRLNCVSILFDTAKIIMFEKQKIAKLYFMLKGIVDCLLGRMGQQVPL